MKHNPCFTTSSLMFAILFITAVFCQAPVFNKPSKVGDAIPIDFGPINEPINEPIIEGPVKGDGPIEPAGNSVPSMADLPSSLDIEIDPNKFWFEDFETFVPREQLCLAGAELEF